MKSKDKGINHKNLFIFCLSLILFSLAGCTANQPTSVQNGNANAPTTARSPQVVTSHGPAQNPPNTGGRMTGGGTPIDTSKFDADIKTAEAKYNGNKNDDSAKMTLAKAYLERANALKDAAQYRSALGDYRRTAKLDPNNEEAKNWISQIVAIFEQMGREAPKEGEEPPPLPFEKK